VSAPRKRTKVAAPVHDAPAVATADGEPVAPPDDPQQSLLYVAQRLENECNQLVQAIAGMGAQVNVEAIKYSAQAFAALRILVLMGVVTEQQVNVEVLMAERNTLATALQQVEQQRLAAQKPQIATVRQPIQIARR
jgi:hypothetical protein